MQENMDFCLTDCLKNMGIGESREYPIERLTSVRSKASEVALMMGYKLRTTTKTEGRKTIRVYRTA